MNQAMQFLKVFRQRLKLLPRVCPHRYGHETTVFGGREVGEEVDPFVFEEPPGTRVGLVGLWASGPDSVHIQLVSVDKDKRERGHGTRMLEALCTEADRQGVTLELMPRQQEEDGLSTAELVAWYLKHGFAGDASHMKRLPSTE